MKSSLTMNRRITKTLRYAYLFDKYFVNDFCTRRFELLLGIEILTDHSH